MLDLAKDGFVVAERNRGFRVVEMSDVDLDEICQIRLLLEVPTTVQVAKIIDSEVLDQLSEIADEIVAAAARGDLIDYLDSDRRYHVLLISQLGNDRLTELVDRMRRQTRLFGLVALAESGVLVTSAAGAPRADRGDAGQRHGGDQEPDQLPHQAHPRPLGRPRREVARALRRRAARS